MSNTLTGLHEALFWSVLGFVSGAVPYSLLLSRAVSGIDIRTIGDGNPGSANAFRAAGWKAGVPALVLDFLKAAVPVAAASSAAGVSGWALVPVGLAPVAGHAFSPFLRWKGGKAIAATFGMWTGLTLWEGPVILGAFLTLLWALLDSDAWCPVIASAGLTAWLALTQHQAPLIVIGLLITGLLALKQGGALSTPPRLRRVSRRRTRRE